MILDLDEFIRHERSAWNELDSMLRQQEKHGGDVEWSFDEVRRFDYLYRRASSDLVKMHTFAAHAELQAWLENLVARAYARMHEERGGVVRFPAWRWLREGFPVSVRRRWRALLLAASCFLVGGLLGAVIERVSPELKADLLGAFATLAGDPSERVLVEENQQFDYFAGRQSFSSQLMVNNVRVAFLAMALGITWGLGTVLLLFANGVTVGIVVSAYLRAGEGSFLAAWLLPHGSFELPAIFLGGAAGLVLARAMFGWGTDLGLRGRLRRSLPDILTLAVGAALMLIWAALVEAFLSPYHGAELYPWKIAFGALQLGALLLYFGLCGRGRGRKTSPPAAAVTTEGRSAT